MVEALDGVGVPVRGVNCDPRPRGQPSITDTRAGETLAEPALADAAILAWVRCRMAGRGLLSLEALPTSNLRQRGRQRRPVKMLVDHRQATTRRGEPDAQTWQTNGLARLGGGRSAAGV